jgi:hypothetical protein
MNRIRLVKKLIKSGKNYHDLRIASGISKGTLYKFLRGDRITITSQLKLAIGFERLLGTESIRSDFESYANQSTPDVHAQLPGNLS